jgi:pimeloyl-ACP methyl ester carboxylesterase
MSPAVQTRRSATIALVLVVLAGWTVGCQSEAKENAVPTQCDDSRQTVPGDAPPEVEIPSSMDATKQKLLFRASTRTEASPLIVSLHTWSGNYRQHDPLAAQCLALDWNYIRPDFRGPNYTPKACGSPQVISDIDDAIAYQPV